MATPAQIAANRANSLKSTGPRSAEGKSASIVIPGEDPADYDALRADYLHEYRPQSASESFHVDTMLRADWHKRRLQNVEADLYRTVLAESPGNPLAAVLLAESPAAKLLLRVQRQIAAFERTWYRANAELRRARAEAEPAPPAPGELASFRQSAKVGQASACQSERGSDKPWPVESAKVGRASACQSERSTDKPWPPIDEKTGKPAYFVG